MKVKGAFIPEIVSQLAEDCASLWRQRENAAESRTFPAKFVDVERLDARVDAQIDGLRTIGEGGWRTALEGLTLQGPGEVFTAAVLAFEDTSAQRSESDRVEALLGLIKKPHMAFRPLVVALDWMDRGCFPAAMARLAAEDSLLAQAVWMRASVEREPSPLPETIQALETGSKFLVSAACETAVAIGERALMFPIEAYLKAEDPETAVTAATASLFLGSQRAAEVLKRIAIDPKAASADMAATALFRALRPTEALTMHKELFAAANPTRAAVLSAGAAGLPELIPFLIEAVDSETLARLAGESFCSITGADLEVLLREAPQNPSSGPVEDPLDENTDLDPDEGKLWPDRRKIEHWWHEHSLSFAPMTKYLSGTAVSARSLRTALQGGRQKLRTAAAQLLALYGMPLFDVRAPAFRQLPRLQEDAWR